MIADLARFDSPHVSRKRYVVGVDEAGRGSFAGPVAAAAMCVCDALYKDAAALKSLEKLDDSKKLDDSSRREIFKKLQALKKNGLVDFEASFASVEEIEKLNIVGATKLAMARAVSAVNARGCLNLAPSCAPATLFGEGDADISRADVLIDGIPLKNFPYRHLAVVKGDAQSLAIAAASIVAKVVRDDFMDELALKYPRYGFEIHKGYGTPAHRQNILIYGACAAHRPSYLKKLRANTKNIPQQISLF